MDSTQPIQRQLEPGEENQTQSRWMSGHERLSSRRLRIAVLFSRLSGYMAACLKAVHEKYQVELLVVRIPPTSAAPFEERHFAWIDRLYDRADLSQHDLERLVEKDRK